MHSSPAELHYASDISSKGIDFKANSQRDIGNCHPAILAIDYLLLKNSLQNELYAQSDNLLFIATMAIYLA